MVPCQGFITAIEDAFGGFCGEGERDNYTELNCHEVFDYATRNSVSPDFQLGTRPTDTGFRFDRFVPKFAPKMRNNI